MTRQITIVLAVLASTFRTVCAAEEQQVNVRYTVDPPSGSVLQARAIHIFLRTNAVDLVVSNILLEPSEELGAVRPDLSQLVGDFENVTKPSEHDEIHLDAKQETELIFRWPGTGFWSPLGSWKLMSFEPGKQTLTLRHVEEPPISGDAHQFSDPVEVNYTAPPLAVAIGGAAGALALALLRAIYRLRGAVASKVGWSAELREAAIAVCAGGLIAGILTFLGDLLSDRQLGVQIAATSWKGGFIIGLFSYKLGDFLAQKLWDEPAAPKNQV